MRKRMTVLALAALLPLFGGCELVTSTYSMAVGELHSDFFTFGENAAIVMTEEIAGLRLQPLVTGGSLDDAELMADGDAQFALLTADAGMDAYRGEGRFAGKANRELRQVAQAFPAVLHLVASDTSGIKSMADLRGRRVSLGMEASGVYALSTAALTAENIPLKDIQRQNLTFEVSVENMKEGLIDAFFVLAAPGSESLCALGEELNITMVPLEQAAVDAITADGKYHAYTIAAETYANQTAEVTTVAVDALLVCTAEVSEQSVRSVAEYIEENRSEMFATNAAEKNLWIVSTENELPLHEGLVTEEEK